MKNCTNYKKLQNQNNEMAQFCIFLTDDKTPYFLVLGFGFGKEK